MREHLISCAKTPCPKEIIYIASDTTARFISVLAIGSLLLPHDFLACYGRVIHPDATFSGTIIGLAAYMLPFLTAEFMAGGSVTTVSQTSRATFKVVTNRSKFTEHPNKYPVKGHEM